MVQSKYYFTKSLLRNLSFLTKAKVFVINCLTFVFRNHLVKLKNLLLWQISSKTDALYMRHVNTRWLTLTPALEPVSKRWDDCKKYFLDHVPNKKEYKATLPKNKRFHHIKKCLDEEEQVRESYKIIVCF